MSTADDRFDQVRADYTLREPGDSDSWNPLSSDTELLHRLCLFFAVTHALRHVQGPTVQDLRVLDVGCGTARSTRMYLDLGLTGEQLTGIDLREGAISRARSLNPGIRHRAYTGDAFPLGAETFDWIAISTVMSSIADSDARRHLVSEAIRHLAPSGYLFYFDMVRANRFAGGDEIDPRRLFQDLTVVWTSDFGLEDFLPVRGIRASARTIWAELRRKIRVRTWIRRCLRGDAVASPVGSHEALLFRVPMESEREAEQSL